MKVTRKVENLTRIKDLKVGEIFGYDDLDYIIVEEVFGCEEDKICRRLQDNISTKFVGDVLVSKAREITITY